MKELDVGTFVAVFQEMLGPWLWVILALAVVATLLLAVVLLRDRGVVPRRLVWAEVAGLGGGVAAVLVMQAVTHSGFRDIGGPIDWVLVALIFAAGAVGATIGAYGLMGLARRAAGGGADCANRVNNGDNPRASPRLLWRIMGIMWNTGTMRSCPWRPPAHAPNDPPSRCRRKRWHRGLELANIA